MTPSVSAWRDLWRESRRCHGFADDGGPTVITAYINQRTIAA